MPMTPRSIAWAAYNAHGREEVEPRVMAISTSPAGASTIETNGCKSVQREKRFNLRARKPDPAPPLRKEKLKAGKWGWSPWEWFWR